MIPVSLSKHSQYFVSRHSLYAIEILAEKSETDMAPLASAIFAPIDVPERNTCLDITNSRFSLLKYWYNLTMRIENEYAFSYKLLSIFTKSTCDLSFPSVVR